MFKKLFIIILCVFSVSAFSNYQNFQKIWHVEKQNDCLGGYDCNIIYNSLSTSGNTDAPLAPFTYYQVRKIEDNSFVENLLVSDLQSIYNRNSENVKYKYFFHEAATAIHSKGYLAYDFTQESCENGVLEFSYKLIIVNCDDQLDALASNLNNSTDDYILKKNGQSPIINVVVTDPPREFIFTSNTNLLNSFKGIVPNLIAACPTTLP